MHDDQFTAIGPSHHTSGFPRAAFSTAGPSDFLDGVAVQAARCGVVGEGLQLAAATPQGIASSFPGVGVEGRGVNFGVIGTGRRSAVASVFGHGNQCRLGVLGAVMDREGGSRVGVAGVSVENMGNALVTFAELPRDADGSGTGVLGMSGTGAGVIGRSKSNSGGDFTSEKGAGVSASSNSGSGGNFASNRGVGVNAVSALDRGGVFQSGVNVAQLKLLPTQQDTRTPELPRSGEVGDLLLIRNTFQSVEGLLLEDRCSLWLCVPSGGPIALNAHWQQVQLGPIVPGTL